METKINIFKNFTFELSLDEAEAIETMFHLIENIEDTVEHYEINTVRLTLDSINPYGETDEWIPYEDLCQIKRVLDFLKANRKIKIEEKIEEY